MKTPYRWNWITGLKKRKLARMKAPPTGPQSKEFPLAPPPIAHARFGKEPSDPAPVVDRAIVHHSLWCKVPLHVGAGITTQHVRLGLVKDKSKVLKRARMGLLVNNQSTRLRLEEEGIERGSCLYRRERVELCSLGAYYAVVRMSVHALLGAPELRYKKLCLTDHSVLRRREDTADVERKGPIRESSRLQLSRAKEGENKTPPTRHVDSYTLCEVSKSAYLYVGREAGRIVGIKRLHDDLGVNTAKVRVTAIVDTKDGRSLISPYVMGFPIGSTIWALEARIDVAMAHSLWARCVDVRRRLAKLHAMIHELERIDNRLDVIDAMVSLRDGVRREEEKLYLICFFC
ncbi:hypothetical protein Tco_1004639 [Tanacetum coccineum]|uniref:Uncharacterized protein n=1 Tax=Tanacetum coccineum TaxID=301880 RepID=A0ABQ5FCV2_9ASTR